MHTRTTDPQPSKVLAFLGFALFALFCLAVPAAAAPTLTILEPFEKHYFQTENGPVLKNTIVFERIAPVAKGSPDQGRISIQMRISNPGPDELIIDRVEILGQKVSTFEDLEEVDFNALAKVPAGGTRNFQNCKCDGSIPLIITAPFPEEALVAVYLKGQNQPLTRTVPLKAHTNDGGPLGFIARADDLQQNEVWSGSSHHPSGHQVFALDLGLRTWDGNAWTGVYPGANHYEKESRVAYGRPVYAMADGRVCFGLGDHTEPNLVGCGTCGTGSEATGEYSGGGNSLFIQTGDEISLYAHFQPHSIPKEYLTPGTAVKRGAYLGKIGFSGNTSGPHVHIHVKKEPGGGANPTGGTEPKCDAGAFRPMTFEKMQEIDAADAKTLAQNNQLAPNHWTLLTNHSFPHKTGYVQPSTSAFDWCKGCQDERTYFGVWRQDDTITLRAKVKTWDAFTVKWQSLIDDRFHLTEIDVIEENDSVYFLGIFRRGARNQGLYQQTNWPDFATRIATEAAEGRQLVDAATFMVGNNRHWVGAFLASEDKHQLRDVVGYPAFTAEWNQLAGQGLALVDIETYTVGNERRFFGIFQPVDDALDQKLILHDLPNFKSLAKDFAEEGFSLTDAESFTQNGEQWLIGIFRPGEGNFEQYKSYDLFVQNDEKQRNEGHRLVDVHVFD